MSKQIQAYFRTESEAEGARTTLQTYNIDQLEVGQLQDAIGRSTNIVDQFLIIFILLQFIALAFEIQSGYVMIASKSVTPPALRIKLSI